MGKNVSQRLIGSHLVEGRIEAGREIGLTIDQTLTQDATETMVMIELEAMNLSRVKTELSAQYVDHNLLQPISRIRTTIFSAQRLQPGSRSIDPCREGGESA